MLTSYTPEGIQDYTMEEVPAVSVSTIQRFVMPLTFSKLPYPGGIIAVRTTHASVSKSNFDRLLHSLWTWPGDIIHLSLNWVAFLEIKCQSGNLFKVITAESV